jgi:hypothetical protein
MFYKYENENLIEGPFIQFPTGEFLSETNRDQFELPFLGWYWFDSMDQALDYFFLSK